MLRRTFLLLWFWIGIVPACAAQPVLQPIENFSFVQITDLHIPPHLIRTGEPQPPPGADALAWINQQIVQPQTVEDLGFHFPVPSFGLATGDLTEYGMIDDTWPQFEKNFSALPFPLYVTAGNHDNTWVAMLHILRQRYGGENYSFDKSGCHFVMLCSATPQEPIPTIPAQTRTWLKRDLDAIAPGTPVFVAMHHPIWSDEFANPAESDTFIDLLRNYNVVLMLYGHGHSVRYDTTDGIDGTMGGSTFGKNAGYALVSLQDERLRVLYHYFHNPQSGETNAAPLWKTLLDKPISVKPAQRLFQIIEPLTIHNDQLDVTLKPKTVTQHLDDGKTEFQIDGNIVPAQFLGSDKPQPAWRIQLPDLIAGRHLLTVRAKAADGDSDLRTAIFQTPTDSLNCIWRLDLPAAVKAAPVVIDDQLVLARTDGIVTAVNRQTGQLRWEFKTGGEILGTPAWSGMNLVFGSGDGKVYSLDRDGKMQWSFQSRLPVYGTPLLDNDRAYIGDNGGRLLALQLESGSPVWTFSRADYSIECRPCLWNDLLIFGAWDGYLYAVDRHTGQLKWKVYGPKSSDGQASRYYAPADVAPVMFGDSLWVCDRGYLLGTYDATGSPIKQIAQDIAAINVTPDGEFLITRGLKDQVCKLNQKGEVAWTVPIPAGRFPIPPACHQDKIYVCSNRGLLSVLAASDGKLLKQYQTTPGFYVMAPITVDQEGICYIAAMDGTVTALKLD